VLPVGFGGDVQVDRIGRYLAVMKTRAAHCKQEAARYAARAKRAESKIARTESMVLYSWRATISSSWRPTISPSVARKTRRTA
jgi:hypothetical protein